MGARAYGSSRNVLFPSKCHIAWCPKYRRRVLTGSMEQHLVQIIRAVCDEQGAEILGVETMPDHVHLLVEVDPSFGTPEQGASRPAPAARRGPAPAGGENLPRRGVSRQPTEESPGFSREGMSTLRP